MTTLSLRGYARHRNTSVESVRRAIKAQRLARCLRTDDRGRTRIDAAIADAEWEQNTSPAQVVARVASGETKRRQAQRDSSFDGPHNSPPVDIAVERMSIVTARPLIFVGVTDKPGDAFDLDKSWAIPMTRTTAHRLMLSLVDVLEDTRHWE